MTALPMSLGEMAQLCEGEIVGDSNILIHTICSADNLTPHGLVYIGSECIAKKIDIELEAIYIIKSEWKDRIYNGICVDNPQQAFRKILLALVPKIQVNGIASSAIISPSAVIGLNTAICDYTVIGKGVSIGDNCVINCGSIIEDNVTIGHRTCIGHKTVIHHDTTIGDRCVISEGAVIGGQGFGFSHEGGNWEALPHIGNVIIGNRVHIGANTCIDRGAIDDTIIGNNVIIDNLVHIAHNVRVGGGSAMAAGVGVAGSTSIGRNCLLAGQVGVVGHITINDGVHINGGAKVLQSIPKSGTYAGSFHVLPVRQWNRLTAYFKKIENLFRK